MTPEQHASKVAEYRRKAQAKEASAARLRKLAIKHEQQAAEYRLRASQSPEMMALYEAVESAEAQARMEASA